MNQEDIIKRITAAADDVALEALRLEYLGRQGALTAELKKLGSLPAEERRESGAKLNALRSKIETALTERAGDLRKQALEVAAMRTDLDVTAPAAIKIGHIHPVSQVLQDLTLLFMQMGYTVAEGPEVDTEWYNFEALNIPADHPARDMQDTFYLAKGNVPRTHTSAVQIRYMENHEPPIRIIAPGKVYRNEDEDARHSWSFYQLEGLVVDEGVSIADLKGTLLAMMRGVLGEETEIRLRPSFFPYTEPSVEMDATCAVCHGKGCKVCSGTGWLELGGAGMVHPQVLRNVGIDSERYSGFAFGFGPERIAMIRYGVEDVREFWRPNLKFLDQF